MTIKPMAAIFGALLAAALAVSYLMRGAEGIAIFLSLAALMGILFGWRTH